VETRAEGREKKERQKNQTTSKCLLGKAKRSRRVKGERLFLIQEEENQVLAILWRRIFARKRKPCDIEVEGRSLILRMKKIFVKCFEQEERALKGRINKEAGETKVGGREIHKAKDVLSLSVCEP